MSGKKNVLTGKNLVVGGWRWFLHNTIWQVIFLTVILLTGYWYLLKYRISQGAALGTVWSAFTADVSFIIIAALVLILFNVFKNKIFRKR